MSASKIIAATVLAVGVAASGYFIANSIYAIKAQQRFVSVKGLAEQEVPADLAIWPIRFQVSGNTLAEVQQQIAGHRNTIRQFLLQQGIAEEAIENGDLNINDREAQMYGDNNTNRPRFAGDAMVLLRTTDVAKARSLSAQVDELVKLGVPVTSGYGPEYYFTKLNEIKPQMIATATQNARAAAEQFAQDSGSKVGAIRTAQQGLFSITPRDNYTQHIKNIRVVTTVDYFLAD